jgi:CSLREA domain-containing protein
MGAAVAAAAADLDRDGVPDLILRHEGTDGPYLTMQRGNLDSLFPDTVQARQRRAEGRFEEAPFFPGVSVLRPSDVPADVRATLEDGSIFLRLRLNADALDDFVVLGDVGPPSILLSATEATITVNSVADSAVSGDARCTLREAILNANADVDTTAGDCAAGAGADAIVFDIGGGGSRVTIAVGSALPTVTNSVTINGNTQGCPLPPCVDLNGIPSLGANGLRLAGGTSTVRGLTIRGFDEHGILVESPGNFIEGNFIGTNADGTVAVPNFMAGVFLSASNTTVGGSTTAARNLLSGNTDGISIKDASAANTVEGNFIGTNAGGTTPIANAVWGIFVGNSQNNVFRDNLVSGNALGGIEFNGPLVTGNLLVGNFIGTDVTGTFPLPNDSAGIAFINDCSFNTIGGTAAQDRNVISGNDEFGLVLVNGVTANTVLGNHIGTDVTGTADLGNGFSGIIIQNASQNTIGGSAPGAGNLISGNDENGLFLLNASGPSDQNEILGNRIGTDIDGLAPIGNAVDGIRIEGGTGNTIGGTTAGSGNVIAGNSRQGVAVRAGVRNAILGNSIVANGSLGIDLDAPNGVTPNDAGDGDSGSPELPVTYRDTAKGNACSASGNSLRTVLAMQRSTRP